MRRTHIAIVALSILPLLTEAVPPDPPAGKRWVLNEAFSDEFNGTKLDDSKWYDYHPKWRGREPGLFVPENVSVSDGLLRLKGGLLEQETKVGKYTYTVSCAAVTSKSYDAYTGYYECRFRASKSTLSTTFWLSTRANADGPLGGRDRYGLELDVQECIGRSGDFKGSHFASGMNANSHFWYTDAQGTKHNLVAEPSVKFPGDGLASDGFNVYGCWWRDEGRATFYYNDGEGRDMVFYSGIKEKPFDQRMAMNLVCETYQSPWIALPTREELLDPARNTCYYDWVRSYLLVGVDEDVPPPTHEVFPIFLRIDRQESGRSQWSTLSLVYSCNRKRQVVVEVRDKSRRTLFRSTHVLEPGLGRKVVPLPLGPPPDLSGDDQLHVWLQGVVPVVEDTATMTETKPVSQPISPIVLWQEDFEGAEPGAASGSNEPLAGTVVQTSNGLSGKVVAAPGGFASASGNAVRLSTGPGKWSSIGPPEAIRLPTEGLVKGTRYRFSFDYHIPESLAQGISSAQLRWTGAGDAANVMTFNAYERRAKGTWHTEYAGTFPIETASGTFIPSAVLPLIRFDQGGVAVDGLAYIDNIRFVLEPVRRTSTETKRTSR